MRVAVVGHMALFHRFSQGMHHGKRIPFSAAHSFRRERGMQGTVIPLRSLYSDGAKGGSSRLEHGIIGAIDR